MVLDDGRKIGYFRIRIPRCFCPFWAEINILWYKISENNTSLWSDLFCYLKRILYILIFVRMSPRPTFYDQRLDMITPWEKT